LIALIIKAHPKMSSMLSS